MSEKKKDKVVWNKGWPAERGVYQCRVDGKEQHLVHHRCDMNRRHWWSTMNGFDVVGCKIEWTGEPISVKVD